jgi:DNA polymerase I-like protein with 3'-5' exonuclease and polymerase domains
VPIVRSETLDAASLAGFSEPEVHQLYCGLDCAVTFEVLEEVSALCGITSEELPSEPAASWPSTYNFERALQAPALDMMLRGFKIDQYERARGIEQTERELAIIRQQLDLLGNFVLTGTPNGPGLNPNSPKQLKNFFYAAMKLPEVWISQKGERKLSLNREVLEKLELYFHARPIIALILEARDLAKRLSVLKTEVSPDGRMRTSYNIGGTNTGRWSSSANAEGTGTNLQNITADLRAMFVADAGWKMAGIDLEQAESREVGLLCGILFGDWSYLDACEGGDLHTTTARLIWPDLAWTGEPAADRALAERKFYREFSYRDMSKRGGHGSNYLGTPFTMSRHLKVPVRLMENFQGSYFSAFPCIPRWHRWTAERLQREGVLTTPFGRRRQFFGRADDDATLRKAIAFSPQSSTGDRLNLGLWRIWKYMPEVQLLAQVHDAVYFQYLDLGPAYEAEVLSRALKLITNIPLTAPNGRVFLVPGEAKVGWNWGVRDKDGSNPDGLVKWSVSKPDLRTRSPSGLERVL